MRRPLHLLAVAGLAAGGFATVAADVDPTTLVACETEDGTTLVAEGTPYEETLTSAPLSYPEGEFGSLGADDPSGGAFQDQYQLQVPLAFTHVVDQRPSVNVSITWETPSDLDLDVYNAAGELVATDHAFNIDTQSFSATGVFAPEPCETYTVVINNSYAIGSQAVTLTADVTSKAPRTRG